MSNLTAKLNITSSSSFAELSYILLYAWFAYFPNICSKKTWVIIKAKSCGKKN